MIKKIASARYMRRPRTLGGKARAALKNPENFSLKAELAGKAKRAEEKKRRVLKRDAGYRNRTRAAIEKGSKQAKARKEQETLSRVADKTRRHLLKVKLK